MTIKGFDLPEQRRPMNRQGNSAASREPIARLQRTIRDLQNIANRHKDDVSINSRAIELIGLFRLEVSTIINKGITP